MTKLLKNKKGFTLVEVIVVAVIVLILAVVAIPLYQGYVNDSRQAAAENLGATVAKAVGTGFSMGTLTAVPAISTTGDFAGIRFGVAPNEVAVSWQAAKYTITFAGDNVVVQPMNGTVSVGTTVGVPFR